MFEEATTQAERLLAKPDIPLTRTFAAAFAFEEFGEYWKGRGDYGQARRWLARSAEVWVKRPENTPAVEKKRRLAQEKLNGLEP